MKSRVNNSCLCSMTLLRSLEFGCDFVGNREFLSRRVPIRTMICIAHKILLLFSPV